MISTEGSGVGLTRVATHVCTRRGRTGWGRSTLANCPCKGQSPSRTRVCLLCITPHADAPGMCFSDSILQLRVCPTAHSPSSHSHALLANHCELLRSFVQCQTARHGFLTWICVPSVASAGKQGLANAARPWLEILMDRFARSSLLSIIKHTCDSSTHGNESSCSPTPLSLHTA